MMMDVGRGLDLAYQRRFIHGRRLARKSIERITLPRPGEASLREGSTLLLARGDPIESAAESAQITRLDEHSRPPAIQHLAEPTGRRGNDGHRGRERFENGVRTP